jgi:hypothetical protein
MVFYPRQGRNKGGPSSHSCWRQPPYILLTVSPWTLGQPFSDVKTGGDRIPHFLSTTEDACLALHHSYSTGQVTSEHNTSKPLAAIKGSGRVSIWSAVMGIQTPRQLTAFVHRFVYRDTVK